MEHAREPTSRGNGLGVEAELTACAMRTVVADTGDLGAVARLKPVDCTTNPTIVLKAIDNPEYEDVVEDAIEESDAA